MSKKIVLVLTVLLVIAGLWSCDLFGPNFSETEIEGEGTLGAWTFGSGTCYVNSSDEYAVSLYPESGDDYIMFTAPASEEPIALEMNLFDLSSAETVTYYDGSSNFIMTDGYIHIIPDETAGTVTVKIDVNYDYNSTYIWFDGTVVLDLTE